MWSFDSLDGEDEVGVGRDGTDCPASVGSAGGAEDLHLGSHIQLQAHFVPTDDHLSAPDPQRKGSAASVAGVEHFAVG